MGFKLVRIDSENAHKIYLPEGDHLVGRGKFLDCNDKRVSRQHGTLRVTTDEVVIKALHENPCFYAKKGQSEAKDILKKDCEIILGNGDRFGLLPDTYWYEILYCDLSQPIQNAGDNDSQNTVCSESEKGTDSDKTVNEEGKCDNMIAVNESDATVKGATNVNDQDNTKGTNSIPNEIDQNDINESENLERSPSLLVQLPLDDETENTEEILEAIAIKDEPKSPLKRVYDNSDSDKEDEKKKKIEPQDPQAGPSNDVNDSNEKADPVAAKNLRPRERCMYGSNCYRRNPQHRMDFCHPGDTDWGDGARGVCPWGSGCRRRDPRHFRDHDHPNGPQQPPPGMRVVHRFGNVFYINAHTVNFYDDHFNVEDEDGDSVDHDYEF